MKLASLALLALMLGACVGTLEPVDGTGGGGGDDDGGGTSVARQMFTDDVAPLMGACAGCHTGAAGSTPLKFLGTGAATGYYTAITAQTSVVGNFIPGNASLLTKGAHQGVAAWTTAQSDTISMWLLAEAQER
jgi:mono/diheme cytochrome c family protein